MFKALTAAGAFLVGGALVGGITLATSVSATNPSTSTPLTIVAGSQWTLEIHPPTTNCEIVTFAANGTFTGDKGSDVGIWSGGSATLTMTWTAGIDVGVLFGGIFTNTPVKEYSGAIIPNGEVSLVVKGAQPGC
jgi:hypothetical protein